MFFSMLKFQDTILFITNPSVDVLDILLSHIKTVIESLLVRFSSAIDLFKQDLFYYIFFYFVSIVLEFANAHMLALSRYLMSSFSFAILAQDTLTPVNTLCFYIIITLC